MTQAKKNKLPPLKRSAGRPVGSANAATGNLRTISRHFRVSEGFDKTLQRLVSEAGYKSQTEALHEALQQLAFKKLTDNVSKNYISKI